MTAAHEGCEAPAINVLRLTAWMDANDLPGRQVDDFDYYLVLARWKLAIVLEQGFRNAGDDPLLQSFGQTVRDLMRSAAELAESTRYGRARLTSRRVNRGTRSTCMLSVQ